MTKTAELTICPKCEADPSMLWEIEQEGRSVFYCKHERVLLVPVKNDKGGEDLYAAADQRYGLALVPEGEGLFYRPDGGVFRITRSANRGRITYQVAAIAAKGT